jgi:replicative DNA helicase
MRAARVPPQALEAEQAVLGACLLEGSAIDRAVLALASSEDFYRDAHKRIFDAEVGLRQRMEPVDLTTLAAELEKRSDLEKCGGRPYLVSLLDAVPTAAHVDYYAAIVASKAILRRLISAGTEIVEECFGDIESTDETVDRAEAAVRAVRSKAGHKSLWNSSEVMEAAYGEIAEAWEGARQREGQPDRMVSGVPTGIVELDGQTNGFQRGDLVVIGGKTSQGKTALVLNTAVYAAEKRGVVTLICTLEMTKESLGKRIIQSAARVDSRLLRSGCYLPEDGEKVSEALAGLSNLPIHFEEGWPMSPLRLLAKARSIEGLGMVAVDYMQKLHADGRHEDARREVESVAKALKQMARELRVPVLAISNLSRAGELRESELIAYEADVVLVLSRNKKREEEQRPHWPQAPGTPEQWAMDIEIVKQRSGWVGTLAAGFIAPYARWVSVETREGRA